MKRADRKDCIHTEAIRILIEGNPFEKGFR